MAIFDGILKKTKGSAGTLTFRDLNGQTVVSEKITKTTNPRTFAQMRRRVTLANLVSTYRLMQQSNLKGFEFKKRTQSDYNKFVAANINSVPVYLTKMQASAQSCVAAPYLITQGSLPNIVISFDETNETYRTNVICTIALNANTTIGAFSAEVIAKNPQFKEGDQLSYISLRQVYDSATNMPFVDLYRSDVILDPTSTDLLWETAGSIGFTNVNNFVGHSLATMQGAFAWVHSRNVSGTLRVSTQRLIATNEILAEFTSEEACAHAVASYGEETEVFLASESSKFEGGLEKQILLGSGSNVTSDGGTLASWSWGEDLTNIVKKDSTWNFILAGIDAPIGHEEGDTLPIEVSYSSALSGRVTETWTCLWDNYQEIWSCRRQAIPATDSNWRLRKIVVNNVAVWPKE